MGKKWFNLVNSKLERVSAEDAAEEIRRIASELESALHFDGAKTDKVDFYDVYGALRDIANNIEKLDKEKPDNIGPQTIIELNGMKYKLVEDK